MAAFFSSVLDKLVRNLDMSLRITISMALFCCALYFFMWSIRKKNDKNPIAWGWFILCIIFAIISVVYVAL